MDITKFLDMYYAERKIITFIPNKAYTESQEREKNASGINQNQIKKSLYEIISLMGLTSLARIISTSAGLFILPSVLLALMIATVPILNFIKGINRRRSSEENLLLLPLQFSKYLSLPPGHPSTNGQIYVGHPTEEKIYFPIAYFHRFVFEHKFAELLRLISSLGTRRIKAQSVEGYKTEILSGGEIDISIASVDGKYEKNKLRDKSIVYKADLNNESKPEISNDLVWFPYENTWKEMARERVEHGLKSVSVELEYLDDYGINAKLKFNLKHLKANLGVEFVDYKKTVWVFNVDFTKKNT